MAWTTAEQMTLRHRVGQEAGANENLGPTIARTRWL